MIKVVNPSVELWKQEGYTLDAIWKHIARCARVCYQSVPKNNGETDYGFLVRTLLKGKDIVNRHYYNIEKIKTCHLSVFEHGTVHLKYRLFIVKDFAQASKFINNHYSKTKEDDGYLYVTTNMRVLIENNWIDELEFIDTTPNCPYYYERVTVNFITDIGASRELNRHRVNSISEESTRYCRYNANKFGGNITVAKLPWINIEDSACQCYFTGLYSDNEICNDNKIVPHFTKNWTAINWFLYGLQIANLVYCKCIELGWTAQQAREILPLNTKTQVVHTAFVDDWQHFIDLRSNGTSGVPHPMAKELADEVKFLLSCKSCG
ncbi:MAG: FAD-dependent thymidylate synthase [bacterium]|nr:FAD-dependent thymidylate synthase [bacterium]MDY4108947.1 FAD-dependent thymidylate synthase [Bacilli bacterium]